MKSITLELINSFEPCYNPEVIGFDDKLSLTPTEFIDKFESKVQSKQDIIWLLCRNEFMSDKDMRLFAVWCAREALKLVKNPDKRSIKACDVAEKFANGNATREELFAAESAIWSATGSAARSATESAQLEKLKEFFN